MADEVPQGWQAVSLRVSCLHDDRKIHKEATNIRRDYKLAAVRKVIEQGVSYSELDRDLGLGETPIDH